MSDDDGLEARVDALEAKVERARLDAQAARHLAAAVDRDIVDLGVKVDADREAIHRLGAQTAQRFDRVDERLDRVDRGPDAQRRALDELTVQTAGRFASTERHMRGGFAQLAAGTGELHDVLTSLVERGSGAGTNGGQG